MQLDAVIIAARLRLMRVIVALALLHTADERDLFSGPTQLGSVIAAARLQLGARNVSAARHRLEFVYY